jgi:hypothetical protein
MGGGGGRKETVQTVSSPDVPPEVRELMGYVLPDIKKAYGAQPLSTFMGPMPTGVEPLSPAQQRTLNLIASQGNRPTLSAPERLALAQYTGLASGQTPFMGPVAEETMQRWNVPSIGGGAPSIQATDVHAQTIGAPGQVTAPTWQVGQVTPATMGATQIGMPQGWDVGQVSTDWRDVITGRGQPGVGPPPVPQIQVHGIGEGEKALQTQWEQVILPSIQNQAAAAGLGTSGALPQATALGSAELQQALINMRATEVPLQTTQANIEAAIAEQQQEIGARGRELAANLGLTAQTTNVQDRMQASQRLAELQLQASQGNQAAAQEAARITAQLQEQGGEFNVAQAAAAAQRMGELGLTAQTTNVQDLMAVAQRNAELDLAAQQGNQQAQLQADIESGRMSVQEAIEQARLGEQAQEYMAGLGSRAQEFNIGNVMDINRMNAQQRMDALQGLGQYGQILEQRPTERLQTAFDAQEIQRQARQAEAQAKQADFLRRQDIISGISGAVTGFVPGATPQQGYTVSRQRGGGGGGGGMPLGLSIGLGGGGK